MKRTVLAIALCLFILSCFKPKPKKYLLKIEQVTHDAYRQGQLENEKVDTIKALDDTTAYAEAIKQWYATLIAEKITGHRVSISQSFRIENQSGIDLRVAIPKKVTDSIDALYKSVTTPDLK